MEVRRKTSFLQPQNLCLSYMCMLSVCGFLYIYASYTYYIPEMKRCWSWLTQRKRVSVSDNWLPVTIILSSRHIEREARVHFSDHMQRHKVQFVFLLSVLIYKSDKFWVLAMHYNEQQHNEIIVNRIRMRASLRPMSSVHWIRMRIHFLFHFFP